MEWLQADALAVPRAAASFDGAVMAYGLRNLPDPAAGLRELRRLLQRDGRAAVLDFNRYEVEATLDRPWPTPFSLAEEIAGDARGLVQAVLNWPRSCSEPV